MSALYRLLQRRVCNKQGHRSLYDVEARTLSCRRCHSLVNLQEIFPVG